MMRDVDLLKMHKRWLLLTRDLGVDTVAAESVFGELVAQYEADGESEAASGESEAASGESEAASGESEAASGRAYHNLTHIQQVLTSAEAVAEQAVDWTAVQMAIWFHDVVYVPGAPDNEAQSAQYTRRILQSWQLPDEFIHPVEQLILATALNGTAPDHPDVPLIQDADIATLGWPPAAYRRYAQAIRREFAHVPDDAYRHGRSQILTHFLQKPRLYHTDYFFAQLEEQARANLKQELMELGNLVMR